MDFFHGGDGGSMQGTGSVAARLLSSGMDTNVLRPYIGGDGRSYVDRLVADRATGKRKLVAVPTQNLGTLRFEQWREIDAAVVRVAKPALQAISDLQKKGLTYTVDAMQTVILSYETVSDTTPATISMNGLRESQHDRPVYGIGNLPLPLIHKDFSFDARQLGVSQATGVGGNAAPLDTSMVTLATRRVVEEAEKLLIGSLPAYYFGGGSVYGYTNFPGRITGAMTLPTTAGWTPQQLNGEILTMRQQLINNFHMGPYMLYVSSDWASVLDDDYSVAYNGNTLRTRLKQIDQISDIVTLNYMNTTAAQTAGTGSGFQMVMIQMTEDVIQLVVGMQMRTIQWETMGGMETNFKVICSLTPRMRQDQNLNSGIVHAVAV